MILKPQTTPANTAALRRVVRTMLAGLATVTCLTSVSAPIKPDYSTFSIIPERNIFNTKRSPAFRPSTNPGIHQRPTETLVLTGTMQDEKGPLAFFDGNPSEYRKVLKPNDSVAGFQIIEIEHALVKLKSGTNEITLPVNMQLSREEQGEWKLGQREVAQDSSSSSRSSSQGDRRGYRDRRNGENRPSDRATAFEPNPATSEGPDNGPTNADQSTSSGGSDEDILARLRARREQENNP